MKKHNFILINGSSAKLEGTNVGRLINKYLQTSQGRTKLAMAMVNPLRTTFDYQGIARRTLLVQQLPTEALPVVASPKDIISFKHDKLIISKQSGKVCKKKFYTRVLFPEFDIVSNPIIRIGKVKRKRFDILEQEAKNEILSQEDDAIFEALDNLNKK